MDVRALAADSPLKRPKTPTNRPRIKIPQLRKLLGGLRKDQDESSDLEKSPREKYDDDSDTETYSRCLLMVVVVMVWREWWEAFLFLAGGEVMGCPGCRDGENGRVATVSGIASSCVC